MRVTKKDAEALTIEQVEAWRSIWNAPYIFGIPEYEVARKQLNEICDIACAALAIRSKK